jgi:hypothetical protein
MENHTEYDNGQVGTDELLDIPAQIHDFIRQFPQHAAMWVEVLQHIKQLSKRPGMPVQSRAAPPSASSSSSSSQYHRAPTVLPSQLYAPPGSQATLPMTVNAAEQAEYLDEMKVEELELLKQFWEDSARHSSKLIAFATFWQQHGVEYQEPDVMMSNGPPPSSAYNMHPPMEHYTNLPPPPSPTTVLAHVPPPPPSTAGVFHIDDEPEFYEPRRPYRAA